MSGNGKALSILTLLLFLSALSFGLAVPLKVKDATGYGRVNVPLTSGVPLPKGQFAEANLGVFSIQDSANPSVVPAAFRALAYWNDGSIKFLGVMFQATVAANATTTYYLTNNGNNPSANGLSVSNVSGVITVNTGLLRFKMKSAGFNLIDEAWVDLTGAQVYDNAHRVIVAGNNSFAKADAGTSAGQTAALSIEYQNQEQVCVRAEVRSADDRHVFIFYVTAFRNKPYVKIVQNWYFNTYVSEQISSFTDLNITYKTAVTGNLTATFSRDTNGLTVANAQTNVTLTGSETAYEAYTLPNSYGIVKGGSTLFSGPGQQLGSGGTKKMGWMHVTNGALGIGAGMRYFWEMAPKHLQMTADGTLELGLYSRYGTYTIPWYGGFGRTHMTFLSFGADVNNTREAFYAVAQPLMAVPPAVWMCGMTQAFGNGVVHADQNLFPAAGRITYQYLFNVYKTNQGTHGYNAYKTPLTWPFWGMNDLHNFICFGDAVEPENMCTGYQLQHFANGYYDFPWLCAITYGMTADNSAGLFGMERALHVADMSHNNVNGDCKGCPGIQQFFSYQDGCTPPMARDWGDTRHWKTLGIFYWYFITGEPVLKEQGIRLTAFPLNSFTGVSQARATAHALEGLVAAYECTHDQVYLDRARYYWPTGGSLSMDALTSVGTFEPGFLTYVVGAAAAYHAYVDTAYTHARDQLRIWALNDNFTDALQIWKVYGLASAYMYNTNASEKATILAKADAIWTPFLAGNPVPQGRQKMQCETYKAPPHFLKLKVENPNYLTTFPQYLTNTVSNVEKGSMAVAGALLLQAAPNPFNGSVSIQLDGTQLKSGFSLKVFDLAGRRVADLTNHLRDGQVEWKAKGLAGGVYVVRAEAGNTVRSIRVMLMR